MTRVLEKDLYEWPFHNETATCEDCGAEIDVPDEGTEMDPPHWRREEHHDPFDDVFDALCDDCYAEAVSEIISGGEGA